MKNFFPENCLRLVVFFLVSSLYLLIVSYSTSPLFAEEGYDSLIFRTVSERWLNGLLPYVETFDHKGAYLYLFNMLGLLISRNWGILLLQAINLTIALNLLYHIGRLFRISKGCIYIALLLTLFLGLWFFPDGNMTEEWSLCFVLYPLLLFLRFLGGPSSKAPSMNDHRVIWSFVYGVCFGIVAFIRVNNASIICGIFLVAAFLCVRQKAWRALGLNMLLALVGIVAASLPVIVYFACHHALTEMLYCVFVFNVKYAQAWTSINEVNMKPILIFNVKAMRPMFYLGALLLALSWKERTFSAWTAVIIVASAITFMTLLTGMPYAHYFVMMLPFWFLLVCYLISLRWIGVVILVVIMLMPRYNLVNFPIGTLSTRINRIIHPRSDYNITDVESLVGNHVPNDELDDVYTLETIEAPAYMWEQGVVSRQKYIWLQQKYFRIDEKSREGVNADFLDADPGWILAYKEIDEPMFDEKIHKEYVLIDSLNGKCLFRRKDYAPRKQGNRIKIHN